MSEFKPGSRVKTKTSPPHHCVVLGIDADGWVRVVMDRDDVLSEWTVTRSPSELEPSDAPPPPWQVAPAVLVDTERRLLEHGAAMVRVGDILGQQTGESLVVAAGRVVRERVTAERRWLDTQAERDGARARAAAAEAQRDDARARVRAAEDAIALHSSRHLEALRILDEQDGDLVCAVQRCVNGNIAGWEEVRRLRAERSEIMSLLHDTDGESLVDAVKLVVASERATVAGVDELERRLRDAEAERDRLRVRVLGQSGQETQEAAMPVDPLGRDYRRRYREREAKREAALERVSGRQELPLVAGGEAGVFAGWVTLAGIAAAVALLAAGLMGVLS